MKAIILAAGIGSRLRPYSDNKPKCLVEVQGQPILCHQLDMLDACGITEIEIITGYESHKIEKIVGDRARYFDYPDFARTNNLCTLNYRGNLLNADTLVLFADVLIAKSSVERCIKSPHDFDLIIDTSEVRADTMRVILDDGEITDIGSHIPVEKGHGNFVGIAKYSAQGALRLQQELKMMGDRTEFLQSYYTQALPRIAMGPETIQTTNVGTDPWIEIDTVKELKEAASLDFYLLD